MLERKEKKEIELSMREYWSQLSGIRVNIPKMFQVYITFTLFLLGFNLDKEVYMEYILIYQNITKYFFILIITLIFYKYYRMKQENIELNKELFSSWLYVFIFYVGNIIVNVLIILWLFDLDLYSYLVSNILNFIIMKISIIIQLSIIFFPNIKKYKYSIVYFFSYPFIFVGIYYMLENVYGSKHVYSKRFYMFIDLIFSDVLNIECDDIENDKFLWL